MNRCMSEKFSKYVLQFTVMLALVITRPTIPIFAQSEGQYTPPAPPPPASEAQNTETAPAPAVPSPQELDQLVGRIALYPDPLLAHVLTASTYWTVIPEAAQWADEHSYLKGEALADAIREDNLDWDPSILALLPFPSVLDMMSHDPTWTQQIGEAVLADRASVMDAVQRMRRQASRYGYLQTNAYDRIVDSDGYIEILPVNSAYIYVPVYDPLVVFFPPRSGFFIAGAIHFGPAIVIGPAFFAWGWAHPYFDWRTHVIFLDHTPWERVWVNRGYYVHPYEHPWVRVGPRVEHHEIRRR